MGPYILFGSLMGDRLVRPYAASRTVAGFIASNQPGTARGWHMRAYHLMSPSQLDMDAAWIAGDNNELIDANGLSRTIDKVAAPAILYVFMISTEWYQSKATVVCGPVYRAFFATSRDPARAGRGGQFRVHNGDRDLYVKNLWILSWPAVKPP
ncbi:hypothetical protein KZX46_03030 (plasmid) [Polymorphobacter sp. PAMC 29334]|uniref:hypothetical protein n=1 Tax=Polymorphobacter sp. PAMC 29334 TaxID=2862331 RepID=UPI001C78EC66|nr:hypothetical protein [Polymorphobacter sp. PAMC 29334]QYE33112.1 hypothetical protein KZX46_03030 [Polymorphobacter sp. PAMC 29334]